ncbi:MAG: HAD family hydrolase [Thermoleophilia bacterium]|nr:HAD family hydrolase [Thermoleophilia bacterium]
MSVRRPDALVFDLDGTLWDAAAASTEGWNRALAELGFGPRVTVDDIRSVSGNPFERCVAVLISQVGSPSDVLLRSLEAHERAVIERSGGTLYAGVAEGLRLLAQTYPLYVVSNCPDWYLEAFLLSSGLEELFSGWDCHGTSGLPKAAMLTDLARGHGLRAAVYLGDTQGDREAAEAAGMTFVHAGYGFGELDKTQVETRGAANDGSGSTSPALVMESFSAFVDHFLNDT